MRDPSNPHRLVPIYDGAGPIQPGTEHYPPAIVIESLFAWCERKGINPGDVYHVLRWDGILGCWCFGWAGMFLGVERDGHIHS